MVAVGRFEGIRQGGQPVEGPLFVDGSGEPDDFGRQPTRDDRHGAEGVAEDASDQAAMGCSFRCMDSRVLSLVSPMDPLTGDGIRNTPEYPAAVESAGFGVILRSEGCEDGFG